MFPRLQTDEEAKIEETENERERERERDQETGEKEPLKGAKKFETEREPHSTTGERNSSVINEIPRCYFVNAQ